PGTRPGTGVGAAGTVAIGRAAGIRFGNSSPTAARPGSDGVAGEGPTGAPCPTVKARPRQIASNMCFLVVRPDRRLEGGWLRLHPRLFASSHRLGGVDSSLSIG